MSSPRNKGVKSPLIEVLKVQKQQINENEDEDEEEETKENQELPPSIMVPRHRPTKSQG